MAYKYTPVDESLFKTEPCITRYPETILSHKDVPYRSALTFNAGVLKRENGEYVMKNKLDAIRDLYDYIIIDCPPSLGMLTVNAMTASDGVVIPMQCEFFALEGLSQLMFTISRIKTHYNKALNVTGILITMHNNRLILSMQVINELRKHYADKLFETTISRNVKVSEAPGFGAPVYYHEKRSKGSVEYMNVAKELVERI